MVKWDGEVGRRSGMVNWDNEQFPRGTEKYSIYNL